jgi:ABC-type transport system involved in multi-copper enzyme maturation permease subunit
MLPMISAIIVKELKAIILSPKFTATFAVCSLLMLLSVYVGINEFDTSVKQYETARQLVKQEMREAASWRALSDRVYRKPDPLQIFASGVNYDIGRWSSVDQFSTVKLRHSAYSDDPMFALFRIVDFNFIVTVVLSLFALLFTYDAVTGERESGTLQLTFSNALPRASFILGKCIGSWLGLLVPLTIPVALCVLMLFLYRVPLTPDHWIRLAVLLGALFHRLRGRRPVCVVIHTPFRRLLSRRARRLDRCGVDRAACGGHSGGPACAGAKRCGNRRAARRVRKAEVAAV